MYHLIIGKELLGASTKDVRFTQEGDVEKSRNNGHLLLILMKFPLEMCKSLEFSYFEWTEGWRYFWKVHIFAVEWQ